MLFICFTLQNKQIKCKWEITPPPPHASKKKDKLKKLLIIPPSSPHHHRQTTDSNKKGSKSCPNFNEHFVNNFFNKQSENVKICSKVNK